MPLSGPPESAPFLLELREELKGKGPKSFPGEPFYQGNRNSIVDIEKWIFYSWRLCEYFGLDDAELNDDTRVPYIARRVVEYGMTGQDLETDVAWLIDHWYQVEELINTSEPRISHVLTSD